MEPDSGPEILGGRHATVQLGGGRGIAEFGKKRPRDEDDDGNDGDDSVSVNQRVWVFLPTPTTTGPETVSGSGDPVVCLHGVPTSSYLYRKVIPALVSHGVNAGASDLPGMGLADRPIDFDSTWSLGRGWLSGTPPWVHQEGNAQNIADAVAVLTQRP